MVREFVDQIIDNKQNIIDAITGEEEYLDLFKLGCSFVSNLDTNTIVEIDNGDYQGDLIFVVARATYQPSPCEHYATYVWYGSCSGCDTLMSIQGWGSCDEKVKNDTYTLILHMFERLKPMFDEEW